MGGVSGSNLLGKGTAVPSVSPYHPPPPVRQRGLLLELNLLPGKGIARRDGGEDILPLLRRNSGANGIDKGVPEDGYKIQILQNAALDVLCQLLALGRVNRLLVLGKLRVQLLHAEEISCHKPTALEKCLVPVRPGSPHARGIENNLQPRPLLQPSLQPLQKYPPLHHLEFGANANLPQLRHDALPTRIVCWYRRKPVHREAVRIPRLAQELSGALDVALEGWPLHGIEHIVVDPITTNLAKSSKFRLVDGLPVHSQAHCLPYALIVEGILGI